MPVCVRRYSETRSPCFVRCYTEAAPGDPFVWQGQILAVVCTQSQPFFFRARFEWWQPDWAAREPFFYQSRYCRQSANETRWPTSRISPGEGDPE